MQLRINGLGNAGCLIDPGDIACGLTYVDPKTTGEFPCPLEIGTREKLSLTRLQKFWRKFGESPRESQLGPRLNGVPGGSGAECVHGLGQRKWAGVNSSAYRGPGCG